MPAAQGRFGFATFSPSRNAFLKPAFSHLGTTPRRHSSAALLRRCVMLHGVYCCKCKTCGTAPYVCWSPTPAKTLEPDSAISSIPTGLYSLYATVSAGSS